MAKAGDAPGLVDAVHRTRPDLAIIDIRMPPDGTEDGARAARQVRADFPDLGVVLLSQYVETGTRSGRFGYLLKDRVFDVDHFLDALRRVAAGGSALDPEVVGWLLGQGNQDDPLSSLTREREVLALMLRAHQRRHRPPALAHRPGPWRRT